MKRFYILPLVAIALGATTGFAADVHVSVSIGDPGYYGPLDVRGYPAPRLVYAEPVIVHPATVRVVAEPLYIRVPVYQARRWSSYCGRYNACNRQVYFVQDTWYNDTYVPRYRTRTYQSTYQNTYPRSTYSNTYPRSTNQSTYSSTTAQAQADARVQPKIAKENAKAAEHQAKENAKAAEKQAKADRKAAEEQAKLNRKAAEHQAKLEEQQAKLAARK